MFRQRKTLETSETIRTAFLLGLRATSKATGAVLKKEEIVKLKIFICRRKVKNGLFLKGVQN
jgi:hypothetical protein